MSPPRKPSLSKAEPGRMERAVLEEEGLTLLDFDVGGGLRLRGLRRSLRMPLLEVAIRAVDETSFEVEFLLPSGSFATSVMREITKKGAARGP